MVSDVLLVKIAGMASVPRAYANLQAVVTDNSMGRKATQTVAAPSAQGAKMGVDVASGQIAPVSCARMVNAQHLIVVMRWRTEWKSILIAEATVHRAKQVDAAHAPRIVKAMSAETKSASHLDAMTAYKTAVKRLEIAAAMSVIHARLAKGAQWENIV